MATKLKVRAKVTVSLEVTIDGDWSTTAWIGDIHGEAREKAIKLVHGHNNGIGDVIGDPKVDLIVVSEEA